MKFFIKTSLILFISSIFLSGCYTQLAVKDYDRGYERDYEEEVYSEEQVYDSSNYYDESYEYQDEGYYDDDGYYYDDPDVLVINNYDPFWRPYHRRYYTSYFPSASFYIGFTYYDSYWWDYYYSPYYVWYPDPWFYPVAYVGLWSSWYWHSPYYYSSWGGYYNYNHGYKYRTNTYTGLRNNGRGRGTVADGRGTVLTGGVRGSSESDGSRVAKTERTDAGKTIDRQEVISGRKDEAVRGKTNSGRAVDNGRQVKPVTKKVGEVNNKDYRRYNVDDRTYKPSTRTTTSKSNSRSSRVSSI